MVRKRDDAALEQPPLPSEGQVMSYLRLNRDFLLRHPEMCLALSPPSRFDQSTRNGIVDMQVYMIERLQEEIRRIKGATEDLIHTSRSNLSIQSRTHEVILLLLEAENMAELAEIVTDILPSMLDVDVATLCFEEAPASFECLNVPGVFFIPQGSVTALLGGKDRDCALFEDMPGDIRLFGEAAELVASSALVRLNPDPLGPQGVLALGTRHDRTFHPGQGTELLSFLSGAIERCVYRFLK